MDGGGPGPVGGFRVEWQTMSLDTARAFFTYLTALIVVVGGFLFLYLTRVEPDSEGLRTIVAGFIGAALQFLFGAQVAQQTKNQVQETSAAATHAQSEATSAATSAVTEATSAANEAQKH